MNFVKNIFVAVSPRYLIRAYVISFAMLAIWLFANNAAVQGSSKVFWYSYLLLSLILFPFAKLVWDEIRDTLVGNNSITYFGLWAIGVNYILKLMVNFALWAFSIFIAPLGILYLWLQNRKASEDLH